MRSLAIVLFPAVFFSPLLVPARGSAAEPHSWCIPGEPLIYPPPDDADTETKATVSHVCSQSAMAACCDRQSGKGRWSLACVQNGSVWHQQSPDRKDPCGRLAWTQGPIPTTGQFYPRDFSLFVLGDPSTSASGTAVGCQDVEGPIAVYGSASISGFDANWGQRGPIAMVVSGTPILRSGRVHGSVYYGTSYGGDSTVTYSRTPGSTTSGPELGTPIDFFTVSTKLLAMSNTLRSCGVNPCKAATRSNSTLVFSGSDPELNVFTVDAGALANIYEYSFSIPTGAAVIVNVTGASPRIQYVGFRLNGLSARKLLFNFPDATSLVVAGSFSGSILAPKAHTQLLWGDVRGTMVVRSADPMTSELHWAPFELPGSGGCLGRDPNWSCSNDTKVDDAGQVVTIAPEAGFLSIPGGQYKGEGTDHTIKDRTSPNHRIWYSFWPSLRAPETVPLAVFFNDGPGAATSCNLFSFNTGPWTLDPDVVGSSEYAANPDTWQQFANLLYIDAPATGFSYPSNSDPNQRDVGTDMDQDAGIFLRVIVQFLLRHPTLLTNPIILVGESYGGTRATLMLDHLYDYAKLDDSDSLYQDERLLNDLEAYFQRAFSTTAPFPANLSVKFTHQVLIEPVVVGDLQDDLNFFDNPAFKGTDKASNPVGCDPKCRFFSSTKPQTCDEFNCDKPVNWSKRQMWKAAVSLTHPNTMKVVLGVDPTTIRWMHASERTLAHGRGMCAQPDDLNCPPTDQMGDTFGRPLEPGDSYYVPLNSAVRNVYGENQPNKAKKWYDKGAGKPIGMAFWPKPITTFITVAKYDTVVYSPSIAKALNDPSNGFPVTASYGPSTPNLIGNGRNGLMSIVQEPDVHLRITMPYYTSGHGITMRQANNQLQAHQLLLDVMRWYEKTAR